MNFETLPEQIVPAAKRAIALSDARGLRPIYGHVHIEAVDNMCIISAFSETCAFSGKVAVQDIGDEGAVVVEAKRLGAVLKFLVEGEGVTFRLKKGFVEIRQGDFRAKLPHYAAENFPELDFYLANPVTQILDEASINAIGRTITCVERDKNSPQQYVGLLFDFVDTGYMRITGMSWQQIHIFQRAVDQNALSGYRFCISKHAAEAVVGLNVETLAMHVDLEAQVAVFESADAKLRVSFVSDTYHTGYMARLGLAELDKGVFSHTKMQPDPADPGKMIAVGEPEPRWYAELDITEFLDAFESCCTVLGDADAMVTFTLVEYGKTPDGVLSGMVRLQGLNNRNNAKANRDLGCRVSNDENRIEIGLHRDRVKESLKDLGTGRFRLWFHGKKSPIIASEVHDDQQDYQFVVVLMPLPVE